MPALAVGLLPQNRLQSARRCDGHDKDFASAKWPKHPSEAIPRLLALVFLLQRDAASVPCP